MFIRTFLHAAADLARDVRFAVRSLWRAKGLAATIVVTLGLGIGANAAVFSIVRDVLLRPLVNRDEDRLIGYLARPLLLVTTHDRLFTLMAHCVPVVDPVTLQLARPPANCSFATRWNWSNASRAWR